MIEINQKILYKAFGFSVLSDIPLPELAQLSHDSEIADIEIKVSDLSVKWFELKGEPNKFIVKSNLIMFQLTDIGIFSIEYGNSISVTPFKGANEDQIRLYILGTCMGGLLFQRGIFPLHGSVVAINGEAYAFIGDSGAGKSTLASAFLNRGFQLLSDDVIAISISPNEAIPFVIPSYPQQKLWQESLDKLGLSNNRLRPIYGRESKYCVPISSQYYDKPLPLVGVFELIKTDNQKVEINRIERLSQIQTMLKHTYRSFLVPRLEMQEWHFNRSINIIKHIKMFQLQRPHTKFTANELTSLILKTLSKEEQ
ncbi:MAG: hypothetical protein K0Q87_4500 [Neobacillus sp.]|jgi:hypothetical protein|nr:hypothetical protein [Neobacillus sp.]